MKPKHQRLIFVAATGISLCIAVLLVMQAFRDNLVFFYSPSEISQHAITPSQLIRVGGLVEKGSIERGDKGHLKFMLTDEKKSLTVTYNGMVPGLFREGQGVIAEGHLVAPDHLEAVRILTKHDERYMPKDVVDALKRSGRWKEDGAKTP